MKVLIIKTGHTETFSTEGLDQDVVSLGDVLRSTVLLHLLADDEVSWLTSKEASLLLKGINQIAFLEENFEEIKENSYDLVINLERTQTIFNYLPYLKTQNILGFTQENQNIFIKTFSEKFLFDPWLHDSTRLQLNWSEKLYSILGKKWSHQKYLISSCASSTGYKNKTRIGFNWKVGEKWPGKSWPLENWNKLESTLKTDFEISWQEGFDDLNLYLNWINSCDFIVTHDSVGLHVSLALNKPLVALFGPTSSDEIELYGLGHALKINSTASHVAGLINEIRKQ